jgi:amino acid transporter
VLASVSDRYHTPTWALVAVYVLGVLSLIIFAFTTLFTFLTGFVAQAFVFLLVSLFGMLFPYIHRDAYQASAAKIEVLGIPLMTIAGAIGTLFLAGVVYSGITDNRAGANTPSTLWLTVIVFAVGFVWFYAIRWFRSRRGVNLDLRFKEIPVE